MPRHDACYAGYQWLIAAMVASKRQPGKMVQALAMMKPKEEAVAQTQQQMLKRNENETCCEQPNQQLIIQRSKFATPSPIKMFHNKKDRQCAAQKRDLAHHHARPTN